MGPQASGMMEIAVHELSIGDSKEWILPRRDFTDVAWKIDRRTLSGTKGWQPPKRERGHAIIALRD